MRNPGVRVTKGRGSTAVLLASPCTMSKVVGEHANQTDPVYKEQFAPPLFDQFSKR